MPSARSSSFTHTAEPEQPAVSTRPFAPSAYQRAIFDWFECSGVRFGNTRPEKRNLIVRARAGTGKTTTILHAIDRAPEESILLAAFNKRIQEELAERLTNPRATAKTLHSLGYQAIRRNGGVTRTCRRFEREDDIANAVTGGMPYGAKRLVGKLSTKAREIQPLGATVETLVELAYDFNLAPLPGDALSVEAVATATLRALHYAASVRPVATGIDYADMIFLPLVNDWTSPDYDMVVVDEAQDMTMSQLELAIRSCAPGGRIVLVGDEHQCQPAHTQVQTSRGPVAIHNLKCGDTVITWNRHGQNFVKEGRVESIASRPYVGNMFTVSTGQAQTRCTPNHKWLVRWKSHPESWLLYLMRRGQSFRVGQCRMFRKVPHGVALGLHVRVNQEWADEAWILGVYDSRDEALIAERVTSARFGIPELCFTDTNHTKFSKSMMDTVWATLGDLTSAGIACLESAGRSISFPFYRRTAKRLGRQTLFETEAVNLLSGHMLVPVAPTTHVGFDKPQRNLTQWAPITVTSAPFCGPVFSLNVETHHKYVADGLVTCNSIYGFRGADSGSLDRLKKELDAEELPLSQTYRCPRAVVAIAQRIVPDYLVGDDAPEGIVDTVETLDELVSTASVGDFVLSRRNAPLARVALRLLRAGTSARIQGRDIGASLKALVQQLATGHAANSISAFLGKLAEYETKQRDRFIAAKHEDRIDELSDRCATLYWLAQDATGVPGLLMNISELFVDDLGAYVVCSSVHKAKGLEAERVFVLRSTFFMPPTCVNCGKRHHKCTCREFEADPDQVREENNIFYVAVTRAKSHLTWCLEKL